MDEVYVTYVDDEHVDNQDYDDNTDDDHDDNNDVYGHISMIYRWSITNVPSPGIFEHSIARYKMILRPADSEYNFLQSGRLKSSK